MIVEIREAEFLAEIDNAPVVVKTREHFLFGKWRYKIEELHSYNQALINAFKVQQEPKQPKQPKQVVKSFKFESNNEFLFVYPDIQFVDGKYETENRVYHKR